MKIWLDDIISPSYKGLGPMCWGEKPEKGQYKWHKEAKMVLFLVMSGKVTHLHLDHNLSDYQPNYDAKLNRFLTGMDVLIEIEKEVEKCEGFQPPIMECHSGHVTHKKEMYDKIAVIEEKVKIVSNFS